MLQRYFNSHIKPYAYYSTDSGGRCQVENHMFNILVNYWLHVCKINEDYFLIRAQLFLEYHDLV